MQQIIEVCVISLKLLAINKTCLEHVVSLTINVKRKAPTKDEAFRYLVSNLTLWFLTAFKDKDILQLIIGQVLKEKEMLGNKMNISNFFDLWLIIKIIVCI